MYLHVRVFWLLWFASVSSLWAAHGRVSGQLTDPQGKSVAGAKLRLAYAGNSAPVELTSDLRGRFVFSSLVEGTYQLSAMAAEFAEVKKTFHVERWRGASRSTFSSLISCRRQIRST